MAEIWVCSIGEIDYRSALDLQERLRVARQQERIPDTLLLLEHNPAVYTRGRRSDPNELTMGEAWYAQRGIEIIETKRGGKVTYHGPGQLVGYPIVRVDDVVAYVRLLEQTLVDALARIGVSARARPEDGPDYTGVWVENRKIASIGVHVAHGVTTHGFAINVQERALEPFSWVVACGLPEVSMTSIESEVALRAIGDGGAQNTIGAHHTPTLESFAAVAASSLAGRLGHEPREVTLDALEKCFVSPTSGSYSAGTLSVT
jgi:lipoyl(octanoyl) transferase